MKASAASFRRAMLVTRSRFIRTLGTSPVCPRCKLTLDREYQRFCDRCGQRLDWSRYDKAVVILKP